MDKIYQRIHTNLFSLFIAIIPILFTVTIFVWFFIIFDEMRFSVIRQHFTVPTVIMISVLTIIMAFWVIAIRIFYKFQQNLLTKNTELKQTEEFLQKSEAHFRDLIENANDLIYTMDLQGNFTSINKFGETLSGYTEKDFCQLHFTDIIAPDHLEKARQKFSDKLTEELLTTYELDVFTKGGELLTLSLNSHIIFQSGEPIGVQGIGRDITQQRQVKKKLSENVKFLQIVLENINNGIVACDANGTLSLFNKATREFHGLPQMSLSPEEWSGYYNLYYADAATPMQMKDVPLFRALNEGSVENAEMVIKPKNGSARTVISNGQTIFDENQRKIGAVVVMHDITERKNAEMEVQKTISLLTSTLEATADGIMVVDLNGRIVTYNRNFVEMAGVPAEIIKSAENSKVIEFVLDKLNSPEAFLEKTNQLISAPETHSFDLLEFKDGRIFERYSRPQILDGKTVGRVVSFRDITERKRAELELNKSEEKHRRILDTIQEGYFEIDLKGNFTFHNDTVFEQLKFSKDELNGINFRQFVNGTTSEKLFQVFNEVFTKGEPVHSVEFEITRKDGTRFICESSVALIVNEINEPVGFRGVTRDISERKKTEDNLRQSESLLAAAQRITHLGSWELELASLEDASLNKVRWSDEVYRIFGYKPQEFEVYGDVFYNFAHPDEREKISRALFDSIENKTDFNIESRIILQNKSERIIQAQAELVYDEKTKKPIKFVGMIQDITERKRANDALRDSENKYRMLIENTSEGLLQVDNDDVIQFVNDRFCEMVGYSKNKLINEKWTEILLDEDGKNLIEKANERRRRGISDRYELQIRNKSGEFFWAVVGGAPIIDNDGETVGSLGVFSDITDKKLAESRLMYDAFHDNLTGLANRALFMDHLRMEVERGKSRNSNPYAVLFLDFDRFKNVNDSLGHSEGDNLLIQIAQRLQSLTRTGDLAARLGGDEFVVLLSEMPDTNNASMVAERILDSLKVPFKLNDGEIYISASIGIALSVAGYKKADDMLRDADIAMYRAKSNGKARYQIFDCEMHEQASKKLSFETEMRHALEREEFEIHYQPILNLETELLIGFEALVRWRHPSRGMIPPFEFISEAEENNLILPLGDWILRESCRQMRQWQTEYPAASNLTVSVNLSAKQFAQNDLTEQITSALKETKLDPHNLKLEITESYIMENSEKAIVMMNSLRKLGVEFSIDDFGTGYSSLSYLHRLPAGFLKIDRSFVMRMTENEENSEIVSTIIKLAQNLKMKVIAEGIETAAQLEKLKDLTCELGQGYYFSKPLEAKSAGSLIAETTAFLSPETDRPPDYLELIG